MRLFWAVELPPPHRAALVEAQAALRAAEPRAPVRWVKESELHLTLRFLGDADDDAPVIAQVRAALVPLQPFQVALGGGGSFGGGRPRVLWAGLAGPGLAPLTELAGRVEDACQLAGFPPERRGFHAHVTLGRVAEGRGSLPALRDELRRLQAPALPPFEVRQAVLFESRLERGRAPVYGVRAALPLGGPA